MSGAQSSARDQLIASIVKELGFMGLTINAQVASELLKRTSSKDAAINEYMDNMDKYGALCGPDKVLSSSFKGEEKTSAKDLEAKEVHVKMPPVLVKNGGGGGGGGGGVAIEKKTTTSTPQVPADAKSEVKHDSHNNSFICSGGCGRDASFLDGSIY